MSLSQNPWRAINPTHPPYVLADDEPHILAFNSIIGESSHEYLDLSLLPDPWVGRLDAPVIVLNLNPGRSPGDGAAHRRIDVREAIVANLRQERERFPLMYLDPVFAETPGAMWWRRSLRLLIQRFDAETVANQVVCLEFHGYHSEKYKALPVTLPSQRFVFQKLQEAIRRDATVIMMRGEAAWKIAVPELLSHRWVFTTRTKRTSVISPRNCPKGWERAVEVIEG